MPTDPKPSASDEALLARVDRVPKFSEPGGSSQAAQLVHDLATRLREVLAERDLLAQERIDARIDHLLHQKDRERLVAAHGECAAKDAEIARLLGMLAEKTGFDATISLWTWCIEEVKKVRAVEAERDALKAQLAEARERALEDAMSVCERLEMANVGDSEMLLARRLQSRECAAAIRALKDQRDSK